MRLLTGKRPRMEFTSISLVELGSMPRNSNTEETIPKEIQIAKSEGQRIFDLEERTLRFSRRVFAFIESIPRTIPSVEACKQLARSSGSLGADYIEANESLGRKDFLMHMKIARKESKETRYWLELLHCSPKDEAEGTALITEATELMKIFGSIVRKTST